MRPPPFPRRNALRLRRYRGLLLPALIGLLLVPILLVTAALQIRESFVRNAETRAAVHRSYAKQRQILLVFSLLKDAETGQRGYIITGQENFLEPYDLAMRELGPERRLLRSMVEADARTSVAGQSEVRQLVEIDRAIEARLKHLSEVIALHRIRPELATTQIASGEGKRLMDEVRRLMLRMADTDSTALADRVATDEARTRRTERLVLVLFLSLGGLLVGAALLILRQSLTRLTLLERAEANAARLAAIFDNTHDALVTFNRSGSIEGINAAGQRMYGYSEDELRRRDAGLLLAGSEAGGLFQVGADGELQVGGVREFIARRQDGETFPAEVTLGRFSLADGEHVVAAIRDVSERRKAERLKAEFVSTVSHELRTPLTSIAGSLGLLVGGAGGELGERAARLISIAHANCQRLVRLINDILDIEKIEAGQVPFASTPLALGELARGAAEATLGLADGLGVRFDVEVAADTPIIRGDADRITQVITNLLSNAAKASPPGGQVEVRVEKAVNGRARLSVRDHGDGVPEDFRERIFTKFAQADSSDTRRTGGTGLGLAISREIVERHGGRVWFDSPPGAGATFYVELPARPDVEPAVRNGADGKALICEDDADAAATLAEMMADLGLKSVIVGSAGEAEAALKASPDFELMLLDLRLPDGHGLDLLRKVRADTATRALPVLIVSGDAADAPHALDVVDWLQKPVDPARLQAAVDSLRANGAGARPLILHVEDDPDLRQLVAETLAPTFDIVAADSLAAAREVLKRVRPKLTILDIALPDGSGLDLLADLRRQPGRAPIILFSAQASEGEDLSAVVDAVLTKSRSSLEYLADMAGQLIRRPPGDAS